MKRSSYAVRRIFAPLVAVAVLGACGDDPIGPRAATDVEFAPELGVNLDQMERLPTGVYIQTLQEGTGLSATGSATVTVAYELWLWDGTPVDQQDEFTFELTGQVIPGFAQGVDGMRVGETRLIVIPSVMGYGGIEKPGIPAHSVLVFRVELLAVGGGSEPI